VRKSRLIEKMRCWGFLKCTEKGCPVYRTKKISSGDSTVKIPERSRVELITKLEHMANMSFSLGIILAIYLNL
jgi:hypothetical protein